MKNTKMHKLTTARYLTGGAIVAGLMAGTQAHGAIIVQNVNADISSDTTTYFDLESPTLSSSPTDSDSNSYEFAVANDITPKTVEGFSSANAGITADPVLSGSMVDSSSAFVQDTAESAPATFFKGSTTSFYGAEINAGSPSTTEYGYIEVTTSGATGYTLDSYAYDTTPDEGIEIPAIPEANNTGLMAVATLGVAGLTLYRRNKRAAALKA
jgi:hypothetical protein